MNWNKSNKFGSRKKKDKPVRDGYTFDSVPEMERYFELKFLKSQGLITDLVVHPEFVLAEGVKNKHGQHIRKWKFTADFRYFDIRNGSDTVEDVKSLRIDSKGKKHGTSQSRDYKLTRNQFMRMHPDIYFKEIY